MKSKFRKTIFVSFVKTKYYIVFQYFTKYIIIPNRMDVILKKLTFFDPY